MGHVPAKGNNFTFNEVLSSKKTCIASLFNRLQKKLEEKKLEIVGSFTFTQNIIPALLPLTLVLFNKKQKSCHQVARKGMVTS